MSENFGTKKCFTKKLLNSIGKSFFPFVTFEVAPGVHQMVGFTITVNDWVKISVVADDVTLKSKLNVNKSSRYEEMSSRKNLLLLSWRNLKLWTTWGQFLQWSFLEWEF